MPKFIQLTLADSDDIILINAALISVVVPRNLDLGGSYVSMPTEVLAVRETVWRIATLING